MYRSTRSSHRRGSSRRRRGNLKIKIGVICLAAVGIFAGVSIKNRGGSSQTKEVASVVIEANEDTNAETTKAAEPSKEVKTAAAESSAVVKETTAAKAETTKVAETTTAARTETTKAAETTAAAKAETTKAAETTAAAKAETTKAAETTTAAKAETTRAAETTAAAKTETTKAAETTTAAKAETTRAAETTAAVKTETAAAAEPTKASKPVVTDGSFLANLDEYGPGDIIPAEKIDTEHMELYFRAYEILPDDPIYKQIIGKSYRENDDIALSDLRYIQIPHYNFDGEVQFGELIVNKSVAEDIIEIFEELYLNEYQIQKLYLVDNYWTGEGMSSDSNSIEHNNSSAFCYRRAAGSSKLSPHAKGLAIDLNPQQNPYVTFPNGKAKWTHANASDYIARDTGYAHMITHDDLAYKLFIKHGFTWGGDWDSPKDYQHFEKK